MPDAFSQEGIMKLIIALLLDVATLCCLGLYLLGTVGIFFGEALSYLPKILSVENRDAGPSDRRFSNVSPRFYRVDRIRLNIPLFDLW